MWSTRPSTCRLTDRLGPRRIILAAGLFILASYLVLCGAQTSPHLFLGLSLLYGLGMSGSFIPMSATLVRWFVARHGLALALANLGGSVAFAPGPMMGALFIASFDWRSGFMAIGILCGGLVAFSGLALEPAFTLPEARRIAAFWIMCAIFLGTWSVMFFPLAHLGALTVDLGWGTQGWVRLFAVVGFGGLFGRAHVGAIAGFAFACTCSGGGLGPRAAGWIRDQSGSYDRAFLLGAAINGLAILFAMILRRATPRTPVRAPVGTLSKACPLRSAYAA